MTVKTPPKRPHNHPTETQRNGPEKQAVSLRNTNIIEFGNFTKKLDKEHLLSK